MLSLVQRLSLFIVLSAICLVLSACSFQLNESQAIIDEAQIQNVECTATIPFDLCRFAERYLVSQPSTNDHPAPTTKIAREKTVTDHNTLPQPPRTLYLSDYHVEEKILSIRSDASAAEKRLIASLVFELSSGPHTGATGEVARHSSFLVEEAKLLAQRHEKQQTLGRLHQQLVKDIPWKLHKLMQAGNHANSRSEAK